MKLKKKPTLAVSRHKFLQKNSLPNSSCFFGSPMKIFLMFFFISFASAQTTAVPNCVLMHMNFAKKYTEEAVGNNGYLDKQKHCAVSCMLAIQCPIHEVALIGILKELVDIFGPGKAELEDLRADYKGIELHQSKKIKTYSGCIDACKEIYPLKDCMNL